MFARLLLLALLAPIAVLAQTDTTFLLSDIITSRERASIYRPAPVREGEKYKVVDYFISTHQVAREGYSYSKDSIIYDGAYIEYYENGRKQEYGNYIKGNKVGQWRLKYEDTDRIWAVTAHIPGDVDTSAILTSFYRNGKVKRKEWTVKGKETGVCYSEAGDEIPYTPFTQMPEFNGEVNLFLAKTIRYPDEARVSGIMGTVFVQFIVNEDGTIKIAKTLGPHESLCKEAARVCKQMPKWKPGKMDNKIVKVYYTQPVTFRLE